MILGLSLVLASVGTGAFLAGRATRPSVARESNGVGATASSANKSASTDSTSTTEAVTTTTGHVPLSWWPGDYVYIAPDGGDAVLLVLSESDFGLTGTWYETAEHADTGAIALNGTETSMPPSNRFAVSVSKWSGGLQFAITNEYETVTLRATPDLCGALCLGFTAEELYAGTPYEYRFTRATVGAYDAAVQAITKRCQQVSTDCGQN